jgi:hypothetical protein
MRRLAVEGMRRSSPGTGRLQQVHPAVTRETGAAVERSASLIAHPLELSSPTLKDALKLYVRFLVSRVALDLCILVLACPKPDRHTRFLQGLPRLCPRLHIGIASYESHREKGRILRGPWT